MSDLTTRFEMLGTAVISDVLDETGYHTQVVDPKLGFVGQPKPICGPAICVSGERGVQTRSRADSGAVMPLYNLPLLAQPGSVMVLSTSGFRGGAVTGELLAVELEQAGVTGLITDGLIRDRAQLEALSMPVICGGAIPTNGARRFQITSWEARVILPGAEGASVTIEQGDYILADADGVVVIPRGIAMKILDLAEELAEKEQALKDKSSQLSSEERAAARADRMSHVTWLR